MRLTVLTLTFLFFGSAFATPINFGRGDNAAVMKRSLHDVNPGATPAGEKGSENSGSSLNLPGNRTSTPGGTRQVIQKRETGWDATFRFIDHLTNHDLYNALKTIQHPPIGEGQGGIVYMLGEKISGYLAVVKVIYWPKAYNNERGAKTEAEHLYQVGQLWGLARTEDHNYYYLIMPYLGVPWTETGLTKQQATDLMKVAQAKYKEECGMIHGDINLKQAVFMRNDQHQWEVHLIDWGQARVAKNWVKDKKLRNNPKKVFSIPSNNPDFYIPHPDAFSATDDMH